MGEIPSQHSKVFFLFSRTEGIFTQGAAVMRASDYAPETAGKRRACQTMTHALIAGRSIVRRTLENPAEWRACTVCAAVLQSSPGVAQRAD